MAQTLSRHRRPERATGKNPGATPEAGPERVTVGRIAGAHGLKGWVKVRSAMDPAESLLDIEPWYLRDAAAWRAVRLEAGRRQGRDLVAKLVGSDDRDAAESLAGTEIALARADFPAADRDEYYWVDLLGLDVVTLDGVRLGAVRELMETGANDVLVVDGDRTRLIPFLPGHSVREVDLAGRVISVDWDPDFG